MSNLSQFFTQLGTDAALLEAYLQDPRGVMQANGITDEEIAEAVNRLDVAAKAVASA